MPCLPATGPDESDRVYEALTLTTQLLCRFCNEKEDRCEEIPDYILEWWLNHKEEDRKREELRLLHEIENEERRKRRPMKFEPPW